ncbi:polymorphic toxin-type HINT domain-containing protein [Myceligenerans xiligouense]|nr:polymorphic toxin-type HINT domain-containing protein [Myceligenerans xiligouense]
MSQQDNARRGAGRGRWSTAGVSLVAAAVTVLVGVDPAAAAPAVGQIVALEVAAAAEVDALEARNENFEEVLAQLDSQDPAATQDLTAPAWEPTADPSAPAEDLPAETLPPVADDPGQEGSTEPDEDVPAETTSMSTMSQTASGLADAGSKLDATAPTGELDESGPGGEPTPSPGAVAGTAEEASQEDGVAATTADLSAGDARVEVDGVQVTVTGESSADAAQGSETREPAGGVRVAAASVEPGKSGGAPGLLVRIDAAAVGKKATGKKQAAGDEAATSSEEVAPADGVVDVRVAYEQLAADGGLPGGDWASRLTLVDVSGCGAQELASGSCETEPVEGVANDVDAKTLTAPMAVSEQEATTLLVAANASGGGGDWGATSLAPAASWGVSGSTGAFTWSYPLTMPSAEGPGPQLSLSYSSAASDGRVASTNNQAGAVGEGWSLTESYIERKFAPCADDQDAQGGQTPNNASHTTGDMCIGLDNATMVLDGQAVDLVKTSGGAWRPKKVDGTKVERKTGASNGDEEGEYWLVTTSDGTKYTFGRGERASDGLKTGSSWTMPVYGNHPGEACYKAAGDGGFAASKCRQTYRWMLEHVVEPAGGTMTYVYSTETRKYGHNLSEGTSTYTAGGFLKRILYGTRTGNEGDDPAPVRVDLEHSTRCVPGQGVNCDAGRVKQNLSAWPDVPGDLVCYKSASECGIDAISPSFYTLYRLARVTTRVHDGSSYKPVDSWRLNQSFVSPGDGSLGDGSGKVLWLRSIQHTGHGGTTDTGDDLSNNKVVFAFDLLPNRIDTDTDGLPPMYRPRVLGVRTESGGVINANYRTECAPEDVPADTDAAKRDNTRLCFPVEWRGDDLPIDWFYKYVVTSVTQSGASPTAGGGGIVTGSEDLVTRYRYDGGAKWVKPTGPLTDPKDVTWSEFRGFRTVVVTEGEGSQASSTTTRYLRGVDGSSFDVGPAGHRYTVNDHDALAGQVVEVTDHNGDSSQDAISTTVTVPKTPVTVATGIDDVEATRLTGTVAYGFSMDAAGSVATRTKSVTTLNAQAQVKQTEDAGDLDTSGDETCSQISYAHAGTGTHADTLESKNMVALVERTQNFAVACADVEAGTVSRPGDVLSDTVATYDGKGQVTATRGIDPDLDRATGSLGNGSGEGYVTFEEFTYDSLGRVTSTTDVAGRTSTTAYTPATGTIPTKIVATGPDPDGTGPKTAMSSTTTYNAVTGQLKAATDTNGQSTRGTYDALGRLVEVVYPQHEGLSVPSVEYEYTTRANGLNVVLTRTLGADRDDQPVRRASAEFYDGLMRVFQTQDEALDTGELRDDDAATRGRQITQVFYDTAGRTWKQTSPQYATGLVTDTPVQPELIADSATVWSYDGAGRPVDEIFYVGNPDNHSYERWRTVTRYDGRYTTVVPPKGGTARTTVADARGRTTALWEHKSRPTVDSDTADGHWYVPSTLPGFDPRTVPASSYQKTSYTYDRFGQMTSMTGPGGNQWTYGFDMGGRQVRASDPDSGTTTTTYDRAGNVARTVNGNGNDAGATQAVIDANTQVFTYDRLGRPTQTTDGAGQVRSRWEYDTTPGPDGTALAGLTSSTTTVHDGLEYTTRVDEYDGAYRPTSSTVVLPDGLDLLNGLVGREFTTTTEYRIDGSVRQQVLPPVSQLAEDGSVAGTVLGKEHVTTFYDDAGLPTWMGGGFGWGTYVADSQFTAEGRPQAMDLGTTYGAVATYGYEHGTGRLDRIGLSREQYDARDVDMDFEYDPSGNITAIRNTPGLGDAANGDPHANDDNQCFDYDGLGRLIGAWTDAGGTCADSIGDVTANQVGGQGFSAAPYWNEYTYDATGNRTSLVQHVIDDGDEVVKTSYEHGAAGPHQVTHVTQQTGPESTIGSAAQVTVGEYEYDAAGNQTVRTMSEPVDPADPEQVEADTDGDGLVTTSQLMGWNSGGDLATVATSGEGTEGENTTEAGEAEYVYTPGGERLVRIDASGATIFLGGQEIRVDGAGTVGALRYYTFAGQTVAVRDGRGLGGVTSLVADHQGSTIAAVPNTNWTPDAVTRLYTDPFGADRTPAVVDPDTGETLTGNDRLPGDRRFLAAAGGIEDTATGLVLLGARYYDAALGRFISTDPQLDAANPAQFNAYVYAGNNPVTFSDASGLSWWSSIKSGASKAAGAVGGFVKKYQAEIVGTVAGAVVFGGCMALTAGAGSVGCAIAGGAVGGAVTNLWKTKVQKKKPFSWKSLATDTALGAAGGLLGAGAGAVIGRAAPAITSAASGVIRSASSAVTSRVSAAAAATARAVAQKAAAAKNAAAAAAQAAKQRISSAVSSLRQRVASAGGGCSFAGATGVLMADGSIKAIEDIKPGDKVIATDPETDEKAVREVEATHVHDDVLVTLRLEDGQTLRTTEDHPFWNATDQEFQRADQLEQGDKVLDDHGDLHTIAGIENDVTFEPAWNLTVAGLHTYHVITDPARGPPTTGVVGGTIDADATSVLVHNCSLLLKRANDLAGTLPGYKKTVAVARVQGTDDAGNTVYQTWVSTNRKNLPKRWDGDSNPIGGDEYFKSGKGHAEATIFDSLGTDWKVVEIASSTRICPSCMAAAVKEGLRKGLFGTGFGWSRTGNTRFRVMYRG